MSNNWAIQTKDLTRYFGKHCVVNQLDLSIPRGSIFGLLGRNGAGKSTALRMIMGMLEPTRGTATVLGHESTALTPEIRGRIGYLAESHSVYRWMKVRQVGEHQASTFPRWNQHLFETVLEHFRLGFQQHVGSLSRGQRAGVCLAATMATEPELLILDDPALGLDPVARRSLLQAILFTNTENKDRTIVFSSHQLADVERIADYIGILEDGQLRSCCPLETFRSRIRRYIIRHENKLPEFPQTPSLLDVFSLPNETSITLANPDKDLLDKLKALAGAHVEETEISLEEAFISYLGQREEKSLFANTQ